MPDREYLTEHCGEPRGLKSQTWCELPADHITGRNTKHPIHEYNHLGRSRTGRWYSWPPLKSGPVWICGADGCDMVDDRPDAAVLPLTRQSRTEGAPRAMNATRRTMKRITSRDVDCPTCGAPKGERCRGSAYSGRGHHTVDYHMGRREVAAVERARIGCRFEPEYPYPGRPS